MFLPFLPKFKEYDVTQVVKFSRTLKTKTGNEFFILILVQVHVFVFLGFPSSILSRNTCFALFCLNLGDITPQQVVKCSNILKTKNGN